MRPGIFKIVFTALCALLSLAPASHAETETLEQAWGQAYQINPSLQAERASLRATDEQVSQALSHWRPSIDAAANVGKTYQYIPEQKPLGTADFADTSRSYGVQVTQPLFRGFRTEAETESAEKQVLAGRAKLNDAEQQLFLDTATAFLDLLRDEQVLDAERGNEDVLQKKLTETQVRYHAGELTQTDVHQVESRLARTHVSRFQAENGLTQDRDAYTRLVGKAPEHLQAPELGVDTSRQIDDVLHLAETRNPKVLSATYSIEAAKADVDLSKGSLLPEINLVGNSSRNWGQSSSLPGQEDSSQVLVQLTMPLYRSGADYSKTRAAEQTVTQRRMELEEARHKAHETANNAWQGLTSAKAAVDRGARDRAHRAHSHSTADELPGGGAVPRRRVRPDAVRSVSRGAVPRPAVEQADQSQTRCTPSCLTPIQTGGSQPHGRRPDVPNVSASCMIQARGPARTISALS
jgi:outer membrane protein